MNKLTLQVQAWLSIRLSSQLDNQNVARKDLGDYFTDQFPVQLSDQIKSQLSSRFRVER